MPTFSERMGLTPLNRPIQLDGIDQPLLNRLWNVYNLYILDKIAPIHGNRDALDYFCMLTWDNLFKENYDEAPPRHDGLTRYIKNYFFSEPWYKIYNLIEFALFTTRLDHMDKSKYTKAINYVLESEFSGFRFIDGLIAPVSNMIETDSIQEALNITQYTFDGHANIHLSNALKSISDKPIPDYRNSVKESISAVGTVVRKITGKNTFGDGLKYLDQHGLKLNNQFKEGLGKFYNYTNDPSTGIRHEIVDNPNPPDFETTKFMLLSCSAFINYIVPLAQKANINIQP